MKNKGWFKHSKEHREARLRGLRGKTRSSIKNTTKSNYSGLTLINADGEYSANPSDYFMQSNDYVFEGMSLITKESKDGWNRVKVLKNNPTKKDLIEWNRKLKVYL